MDLSKLNPKNWFRRADAPKPVIPDDPPPSAPPSELKYPHPDYLPKYKVGQRCLVLKTVAEYKMGTEIVLGTLADRFGRTYSDGRRVPIKAWAWIPAGAQRRVVGGKVIYTALREAYLMALDDPKVQEELNKEVIDAAEQAMLNFARISMQFDILARALDQQLKPKAI